jgi:hypothetical protein
MRLLPLILLLLPCLALADVKPDTTRLNNRCTMYAICKQQSVINECVSHRDNTQKLVLEVGRFAHYTFYSTRSTAADYSCDIMTNTLGYDGAVSTDQVNTTSITDEAPVYTMAVLLHSLWITCTAIDADLVNIDVVVCAME